MKVKAIQPAFFSGSRVRVGQDLDQAMGTLRDMAQSMAA